MKNRIKLLLTSIFILMLFAGLTSHNLYQSEDSLDLQTIMRLLMLDVHTINEGIYTHNYDLIEAGTAAVNGHPSLSDDSRALVQQTLDDRMPAFVEFDNLVHDYADSIREAALDHNMERVLNHYRIMEQGCVNCHTAFQDEIRIERMKLR
jgi:hypothetical protein